MPFNLPSSITRGTATISKINYDPEHRRFRQTTPSGTTLYLWDPRASGVSAERFTGSSGPVRWTSYLFAGGEMIGMRVDFSAANTASLDMRFPGQWFSRPEAGCITTGIGSTIQRRGVICKLTPLVL